MSFFRQPILQQIGHSLTKRNATIANFSFYSNGKLLQSFQNITPSAAISVFPLGESKGGQMIAHSGEIKVEEGLSILHRNNNLQSFAKKERLRRSILLRREKNQDFGKQSQRKMVASKIEWVYKKQIQVTERSLTQISGSNYKGNKNDKEMEQSKKRNRKNALTMNKTKQILNRKRKRVAKKIIKQTQKRNLSVQLREQIQGQPKKKKLKSQKSQLKSSPGDNNAQQYEKKK